MQLFFKGLGFEFHFQLSSAEVQNLASCSYSFVRTKDTRLTALVNALRAAVLPGGFSPRQVHYRFSVKSRNDNGTFLG